MLSRSTPWTYTISIDPTVSHQFFVAPANNPHWRFLFASCNGFSASVTPEVRAKLGGVGALWKDVLELHRTPGREFHVMIGGGDQVYADPIWKELPSLQAWLALKGKENRRNAPWSPQLENDVSNYYFNLYTTHFNSPHLKEAAASIPSIYQIDDHDIWDGFGSYPEYLQHSIYFQNMGRIAWKFYRIFQQHTTERLVAPGGPHAAEFLIPGGNTYHFIKLLGPNVALVGPDTRGERNPMQVLSPQSYDMIFNYMATRLPPTVRHVIWMLAVPIAYPRLSMPETLLKHFGKAKTGANKAVNQIGKGVGAVAGGAGRVLRAVGVNVNADQWQTQSKGAVDDVLGNMKKGLGKSGLMSSVISQFGEVDLLDDMIDHWTHPNHAAERTAFVQRCQEYSRTFHRRITFISGDVHCAGIGRFYNPAFAATPHTDPSLMYQIIASAIVNIPPPNGVLKMLHSNAKVYDLDGATKEDMLDMFPIDVDGSQMQMKKLIGRRNYGIGTVDPKGQDVSFELRIEGVQEVGRCVSYGPVIVPPLQ
ncbi:hypothetical protein BC832DRAFT_552498 [Gaertneriomyces semiglobifer]|nr:hypothetical protein BC832DRAFT_552498 [Gaertneriomyces semiglobifer]